MGQTASTSQLFRWAIAPSWSVLPLATGCAILAAAPAGAITLSRAETTFRFDNFSHLPQAVSSIADTDTFSLATQGEVNANAIANALFFIPSANPLPPGFPAIDSPPFAWGTTTVQVDGEGSDYEGLAQGMALALGHSFLVGEGDTFALDFMSSLSLRTTGDSPQQEYRTAQGDIFLELYELPPNSPDSSQWSLLDSFKLSSRLDSSLPITGGDRIAFSSTDHIWLTTPPQVTEQGTAEDDGAIASVQGTLSRKFDTPSRLLLLGYTTASAEVKVPEPSLVLALVIVAGVSLGLNGSPNRNH